MGQEAKQGTGLDGTPAELGGAEAGAHIEGSIVGATVVGPQGTATGTVKIEIGQVQTLTVTGATRAEPPERHVERRRHLGRLATAGGSLLAVLAVCAHYARSFGYIANAGIPLVANKLDRARLAARPTVAPMAERPAVAFVTQDVGLDYRGTLRHMLTKRPLQGFAVSLLGTSCESETDRFGVFSFSACDEKLIRRLI